MILGCGVVVVTNLAGCGQNAAVGCGSRNGTGIHQRHAGDLTLAGLGAFAVGEIAGGVADAELAIGRGITCAEAGAAEAFAEDAASGNDIGHHAVLDQLQVGGHAVRVSAELELAVAAALAAQDVSHSAQVLISAAGAASHNALIHINAAVGAHLADKIHLDLTAQLLIGAGFDLMQQILGVCLQFADGVSIAGMHGQCDHALDLGKIQLDAAIVIGNIGGLQLFISIGTAMACEVFLGHAIGLPDTGPAGGLGGHTVNAVAAVCGKAGNAGANKFHDLILHITVGIGCANQGQRHVMRANAGVQPAGQVNADHAGHGHIIGTAHQLFGQLAAAFAHGHSAQCAIAGMGVRAQDHAAAACHHLAVIAVDNCHVGRNINAAVFMRSGKGKLMVVLVDGAAHRTQRVVAVGQHIRQGGTFPCRRRAPSG